MSKKIIFILIILLCFSPLAEAKVYQRPSLKKRYVNTSDVNFGPGLLAYYTFDGKDVINGTIKDVSGSGNNLTSANMATSTMYATGKIGQAVMFDKTNDIMNAQSDFIGNSSTTISVWTKPDGTIGQVSGRIIDNSRTILRVVNSGSNFQFLYQSGGGASVSSNLIKKNDFNKWIHVIVTHPAAGMPQMYINGVRNVSIQSSGNSLAGTNVIIGNASAGNRTFGGLLDELRIYNRAVSADEAYQLYVAGLHLIRTY